MKRRDFVKNTAIAAIGTSLILPLHAMADNTVTHLNSDDISPDRLLNDEFPVRFMAIGDWGRNGENEQLAVAQQMGLWAGTHPTNFIVSVGDNFYPKGVISENDPLWHYSFENIYTAHKLQCDWYPVLGNHDYLSDPDAQIRYSKISRRWNMPARYYSKEVSLGDNKGKVLFIMIDTDPIVRGTETDQITKQLSWLQDTLAQASSDIKWKIVVGHHPCYTVGPRINNYDTLTIRGAISKLLDKFKVDIYLSGHDHSLQHLQPDGFTHQFISGAGSELTSVTQGVAYSRFQASENGFMYFSVNTNKLNAKMVSHTGEVLYQTELTK